MDIQDLYPTRVVTAVQLGHEICTSVRRQGPLVVQLLSPNDTTQPALSLLPLLSHLERSKFGAYRSSSGVSRHDVHRAVRLRADGNQVALLIDFEGARVLAAGVVHGDGRKVAAARFQRKDRDGVLALAESRVIAV